MDAKLKHLELIQGIINRLAGNLFLLKGWGITLVVGTLALLSSKDAQSQYVLIALLPITAFWLLDGYFLSQERLFRALYADVASKGESEIDFSMDTSRFNVGRNTWVRSFFSGTLTIFYGLSLVTILGVWCIGQHHVGQQSLVIKSNRIHGVPVHRRIIWQWDRNFMR